MVEFGIDRGRYHGGDLEGTSIIRLFQNADNIFKQFSIAINKIITNYKHKKEVEDHIMRYIEIYTLFHSLFAFSRTLTEIITSEIIDKLEIVLSTKMVKIHGIDIGSNKKI